MNHFGPDTLARRILDRIEEERLSPRPRWEFVFKNSVFWALGALAVALGALAFAAAAFEVENAGWGLYAATHDNLVTFFLSVAPFLWSIAFVLFIGLGYANVRRTKRGYRYPLVLIAAGALLTSVALGAALNAAGFGGEIEEALGDHPPFYRPILLQERDWWLSPQEGLLGGTVSSVAPASETFVLTDFSGHAWTVDASEVRENVRAALVPGGTVRVVGTPSAATSSAFHACFVFSWKNPPAPWQSNTQAGAVPSNERISPEGRSEVCKDIRPYATLRSLDDNGF